VAQNNKADGVNDTPITVVASIDPEFHENLIDIEEIDVYHSCRHRGKMIDPLGCQACRAIRKPICHQINT
jgi:hypothetical protein